MKNEKTEKKLIQLCEFCDEPTGKCKEDSLYTDDDRGPLCENCFNNLAEIV